MNPELREIESKYEKLSATQQSQAMLTDLSKITDPEAYSLAQDIINYDRKELEKMRLEKIKQEEQIDVTEL